ncbi:ABC transporter substrate-binding protein [Xanthobacter tagetidis]|uniref:ABC transporter substrate-binding protein n=1 Tax=Xanthobacter tagetidis TaxID=60216 RepID=A0A3L7AE96_9HYPH|nr:ABC transporter substrate-binding protein [Xanthobacter tagetidis]MBB6309816.1 branched-chain amino acid transport system substrate-binding protein [Xanthobacter tagetidis]RLP78294.1 ABC transporter substrate-binding protein [Xanthobacter tagetidis]
MTRLRHAFAVSAALAPLALAAAFPAAAQAPKVSDDVVKIGLIEDMSGVYADITGMGAVTAARMAVEEFGGKVLGKPVEVVFADHQNKADIGGAIARRWFDSENVDAILDVASSSPALAALEVAKDKKKIIALSSPGSIRITNDACGPYVIHWAYDSYAIAHSTGTALVKQGNDSWYFIVADYAFGHSLAKDTGDVVTANGGKVVGSTRLPVGTTDFASALLQAQGSGAKVVALANAGGDTINSIKQAAQFGITQGGQKLATLAGFINDVHGLGLKEAQGLTITEASYWDMNDETRKWSQRFFEKMKAMPNMLQTGTYSATLHYLKAVEAAGTDETEAVMRKMREIPVNDVFYKNGKIRVDGRMVHDMYLFQVKKPSESKGPWDYYNLIATIPGDQAFQPLALSTCPLVKK